MPGSDHPCRHADVAAPPRGGANAGFSLIELAIAVAVVGVLASIAYPSYRNLIDASRRTDATSALLDGAQRLERCFTRTNRYDTCALSAASPARHYRITAQLQPSAYSLVATPFGMQQRDASRCASLAIDHRGEKSATGTLGSRCWE